MCVCGGVIKQSQDNRTCKRRQHLICTEPFHAGFVPKWCLFFTRLSVSEICSLLKVIELKPSGRRQRVETAVRSLGDTGRLLRQLKDGSAGGVTLEELRKLSLIMPSPDEVLNRRLQFERFLKTVSMSMSVI